MKKFALQSVGISALVVIALTGCGGSTGSTDSDSQQATASPTPTAAKQYTDDELVKLVKQIKPKSGKELTVASSEELAQENPMKALMSMFTIEPAEYKDLATLGGSGTIAGATTATGADLDAASGVMTMATLTSGLDRQKLQDRIDQSGIQEEKRSKMMLSMSGQSMNLSTEKFDGINTVPGTVAYETEMSTASGSAQPTWLIHQGGHADLCNGVRQGR